MIACPGFGLPGCPSRYRCYPNEFIDFSNSSHSAEQPGHVCLCDKPMLFHGESCEKNSALSYIILSIMVAHCFYANIMIACMVKSVLVRRRCAKDVIAASILCFVGGLVALTLNLVTSIRLHPDFDDRLWESWLPKILSLFLLLASLEVGTVGHIFFRQLQAAGVIRGKVASSIWKLAVYFCLTISVVGCFMILTSQSSVHLLEYAVSSIIGIACLMAVAAFRTQRFLSFSSARYAGRVQSISNLAQHQLVAFVKAFCLWLGLCSSFAISIPLFSHYPIGTLRGSLAFLQLGMVLSLNQLGLVLSDYFLLPEKRPQIDDLILFIFEMLGHLLILVFERPAERPAVLSVQSSFNSQPQLICSSGSGSPVAPCSEGSTLSKKAALSVSRSRKAMFSIEEENSPSHSSADEEEKSLTETA
mmetsp:Transcript_8636/g.15292  ORF Transcript_8636/g.15292 Transcript_8636/m.15292 type:complete len:417 (-) Transcript_8636:221-1471(-)